MMTTAMHADTKPIVHNVEKSMGKKCEHSMDDSGTSELTNKRQKGLYYYHCYARLTLCIMFLSLVLVCTVSRARVPRLSRACPVSRVRALITTEDSLMPFSWATPTQQKYLLVRPWDHYLLELPDFTEPPEPEQLYDFAEDAQSNCETPPKSPSYDLPRES